MSCRLDKYVWAVRLAKTRSQATELINKGKVRVNGLDVKPAREVKIGDEINVFKHTAVFSYKVLNLLDKRVGPKLVQDYILETTPEEEINKFREYQENQRAYRANGMGKPSKKQRRDLDDFLDNW